MILSNRLLNFIMVSILWPDSEVIHRSLSWRLTKRNKIANRIFICAQTQVRRTETLCSFTPIKTNLLFSWIIKYTVKKINLIDTSYLIFFCWDRFAFNFIYFHPTFTICFRAFQFIYVFKMTLPLALPLQVNLTMHRRKGDFTAADTAASVRWQTEARSKLV